MSTVAIKQATATGAVKAGVITAAVFVPLSKKF